MGDACRRPWGAMAGVALWFPNVGAEDFETLLCEWALEWGTGLVGGTQLNNGRRTGFVVGPDGKVAGTSSQTHRLPDEAFTPGDQLIPVPITEGKLGLTIGSDGYFPETHLALARQGADWMVHLDVPLSYRSHGPETLSLRARAFDAHRPLVVARATSRRVKLVTNEEMQIAGEPMEGSQIVDQNGVVLAETGFSRGLAMTDLRLRQYCEVPMDADCVVREKGVEVYKLRFMGKRREHFEALRQPWQPPERKIPGQRRIRVAIVSHFYYGDGIDGNDDLFLALFDEACRAQPDVIMTTEMEKTCRPDDPRVQKTLEAITGRAASVRAWLIVGGCRPSKPGSSEDRISHGWLWDREGRRVFESPIMLYGKGHGQGVWDTDFGRIGIRLCGDVYAPELDRLFALADVDVVFNPSMSWGASGAVNLMLNQARAIDNGFHVVSGHLAFSDHWQRSYAVDPCGMVVAASRHYDRSIVVAELDLGQPTSVFVRDGERPPSSDPYLAAYRGVLRHRRLLRRELISLRRPELYEGLDRGN